MAVAWVAVHRAAIPANSVQYYSLGRRERALITSSAEAVPRLHPAREPRIRFSVPLNSLETRPDCYRVYKEWCDDVEDDLRTICTKQMGLGLAQTRRVLHAAREHHTVIRLFLNPARILSRVYSWRLVEQELTGSTKSTPFAAELFAALPTLISQTSGNLLKKAQHIKQLLDAHCTGDEILASIKRRPQLLQRSKTAITTIFHTLSDWLGEEVAAKTLLRYPELVSRSPKTIEKCFKALKDEVGPEVAVRMVSSNPSALVRKDMADRWVRVRDVLNLPPDQAATVIRALPTILNIPPETLHRRLQLLANGLQPWYLTHSNLKPSVLGRLLTSPDVRLMRLNYIAFLHGFGAKQLGTSIESDDVSGQHSATPGTNRTFLKAPLSFVSMPEDEFVKTHPRFSRWLRRKQRAQVAPAVQIK